MPVNYTELTKGMSYPQLVAACSLEAKYQDNLQSSYAQMLKLYSEASAGNPPSQSPPVLRWDVKTSSGGVDEMELDMSTVPVESCAVILEQLVNVQAEKMLESAEKINAFSARTVEILLHAKNQATQATNPKPSGDQPATQSVEDKLPPMPNAPEEPQPEVAQTGA